MKTPILIAALTVTTMAATTSTIAAHETTATQTTATKAIFAASSAATTASIVAAKPDKTAIAATQTAAAEPDKTSSTASSGATLALSAEPSAASAEAAIKVKITGVRQGGGMILVAVTSPTRAGMITAQEGIVEWSTPREGITAESKIYLFHDANGNFKLDRKPDGTPMEGCASGILVTSDDAAAIPNGDKPSTKGAATPSGGISTTSEGVATPAEGGATIAADDTVTIPLTLTYFD